jgi:serine/threonine protein kinase
MIWIYGIAFGMALLHSRRIMHRDLKLPNVLLDANLHPKICDFGLSKDFAGMNSLSQTGEKGRLAFMAPEILEGNDFSWSVDVFAFGMTVWMIVTGQRRFAHKRNEFQIGMEIMSGKRPPLPAELPQTCCNLITECWTQEPRDRPTFPRIVSCFQSGGLPLETVDESAFNNYKRRLGRVPVISERK